MALAEPALRAFGVAKLQRLRFRGGSLLGTAIGTAIGIGFSVSSNWDVSLPWTPGFQPHRTGRPFVGNVPQTENASTYQQSQALRTKGRNFSRFRRYKQRTRNDKCCCCSCRSK